MYQLSSHFQLYEVVLFRRGTHILLALCLDDDQKFFTGAIDAHVSYVDKIIWMANDPVCVNQWPLPKEKLALAQKLGQEQL